jgi:hypothetical protein
MRRFRSRRAVAFAGLAVTSVALAGCIGDTDPATDVTSTTATLHAHGRTNDGPAYWWWEFAEAESSLGSANGLRICGNATGADARCGPASSSNDVKLSQAVSNLKPGKAYFFRACGQDTNDAQGVCGRTLTFTTPATAGSCAKWASNTGSDLTGTGSQTAPYWTLKKLVASLSPGQTGCLAAGQTYYATEGKGNIPATQAQVTAPAPVTITSGPGTPRAKISGAIDVQPAAHDIVLTGIDFVGSLQQNGSPFQTKGTYLLLRGDRISLINNDIADSRNICVQGGKSSGTDPNVNDLAEDLKIMGNRIHECGMEPSIVWTDADSGVHGIYLQNTLRAKVTENLIYRNRWRGLQLWPRNDSATIAYNVFDENATHVNIGSSLEPPYTTKYKAERTTVRDNIFTGRVTTFFPSKNESQVFGNFPPGSPSYGNIVTGNCFSPGDTATAGYGFTATSNTTAQALFVNRAARDYRLQASSPCRGDGPAAIQP